MAVDEANRETADRGDFDPRYDPAFQRGYQPKPGERPRTRVRDAAATAAFQRPAARAVEPVERADRAERVERVDASADAEYGVVEAEAEAAAFAPAPGAAITPTAAIDPTAAPALAQAALAQPARGGILATVDFSPRRNRAVLTLWLVGAALIALGILLYVMSVFTSYTNPSSGSDVTGLVFSQLGWMLAGPLITVGLATLVVLLALTLLSSRGVPASVSEAAEESDHSD